MKENIAIVNIEIKDINTSKIERLNLLVRDSKNEILFKKSFEEFDKEENEFVRETLNAFKVKVVAIRNIRFLELLVKRKGIKPFTWSFNWIDLNSVCARGIGRQSEYLDFCLKTDCYDSRVNLETYYKFLLRFEEEEEVNLKPCELENKLLSYLLSKEKLSDLTFFKLLSPKQYLKS